MTISTETFLTVGVGATSNDGTGDTLRTAFIKVNENFTAMTDIGFDAGNINVAGSIEAQGNVLANAIYSDNYFWTNGISIFTTISYLVSNANVITTLTANAASQAGELATLTANAAAQAGSLSTLISNAALQAGELSTLLSNAAAQSGAIGALEANAAAQAGAISALEANAASQAGDISTLQANAAAQAGQLSAITDGTAVFGNLIPSANITYSLGNITHQWKDLWVSNTTIYVGGTPISIVDGDLTVNGNVFSPAAAGLSNGTTSVSVDGANGNVVANIGGTIVANITATETWFGGNVSVSKITLQHPVLGTIGSLGSTTSSPYTVQLLGGIGTELVIASGTNTNLPNIHMHSIYGVTVNSGGLSNASNLYVQQGNIVANIDNSTVLDINTLVSSFSGNLSAATFIGNVDFTMANVTHWTSNVYTIAEAINQLAQRIYNIENP